MKRDPFAARIGAELGAGVQALSPSVLARLAEARAQALAAHDAAPQRRIATQPGLSLVLAVGVALAMLAGGHWSEQQRLAQQASFDAQLLSDDLPVDAYLDLEFKTWLQQQKDS